MSFRLTDIRKSLRLRREPADNLENIEENKIFRTRIDSITDCDIQRQCRQSLRIKEGADRIYNLSENVFQKLDAAKAIFVSAQKIERVASQYENNTKSRQIKERYSNKSKGQITLSDIKVPLLWKSINGQPFANGTYSVFCIIKAGTEVLETQLICDIDITMSDVVFSDVLQINDVDYNSECFIELYGYAVNHSSIGLTRRNSRRASAHNEVQLLQSKSNKKYVFKSLGYIKLCINDSSQHESSSNLLNSHYNADCDIPLFGTVSYKFLMIPMSKIKCLFSGQAQMQFLSDGDSTKCEWVSYHCEIKDRTIHCWKYTKHIINLVNKSVRPLIEREDVDTADQIIPLSKQTELSWMLEKTTHTILKIGTFFDEKFEDFQEIIVKSDQIDSIYEALRNHLVEIDIWSDHFDYSEKTAKPTSLLRQGSVFRNQLLLKRD